MGVLILNLIWITSLLSLTFCDEKCTKLDIITTSNVENEGFHRDIKWLIEFNEDNFTTLDSHGCNIALHQDIPAGIFVNPDQIEDLIRVGKISAIVYGKVDVETPMHLSEPHLVYIYNNNSLTDKIQFELPIHLRYQRAQIAEEYGKVKLPAFSLLLRCEKNLRLCGKRFRINAPCSYTKREPCLWNNITYQGITNEIEMLVPIGDLDHYPLVSIVTLLVACTGCIYILSVLSTTVL